jgi:hypothetical protein
MMSRPLSGIFGLGMSGEPVLHIRGFQLSHCRNGIAVDEKFRGGDCRGACRYEEGNKIRHFPRFCRSADGDAAKRGHQTVARMLIVGAGRPSVTLDEADGGFGLNPTR